MKKNVKKTWNKPTIFKLDVSKTAAHTKNQNKLEQHNGSNDRHGRLGISS